MNSAKENEIDVIVWKIIGRKKHIGRIKISAIRKARGDFCVIPLESQQEIVSDIVGVSGLVDLFIPSMSILFRCKVNHTERPMKYYFKLPGFLFQSERRREIRWKSINSLDVMVKFSMNSQSPREVNQKFSKNCFDLSTGGFSLIVSKTELKFFNLHDFVPDIELFAGKWKSTTSAEICTIREIRPDEFNGFIYKVWKVSFKFKKMDTVSKKYLEKFILGQIKGELRAINS